MEVGKFYIAKFYKNQLEKFEKIGMGNDTENGVRITHTLIKATQRRLDQVSDIYTKYMEAMNDESP